MRAVEFHPADTHKILAVTLDGLYESVDSGISWHKLIVPPEIDHSLTDVKFNPREPEIIYLATEKNGVLRSGDGGGTWSETNEGLLCCGIVIGRLSVSAVSPDTVYALLFGGWIYRSDDRGIPGWKWEKE